MTTGRGRLNRSLRRRTTVAAGIGCLATLGLALAAPVALGVGPFYAVKSVAIFALIMAVATSFVEAHHPFGHLGPANYVTTARAVLVALVTGMVGESLSPRGALSAAVVALLATASDGVDGWYARRSKMASRFGARFDMEVDALLILSLAALVYQFEKAGAWVLASGLLRYLFVAGGWVWPWLERPLEPSLRRQTVCVVQTGGLIGALAPFISAPLAGWISAIALGALGWSFAVDVVWLWRRRR